jgi:hypothetical protein
VEASEGGGKDGLERRIKICAKNLRFAEKKAKAVKPVWDFCRLSLLMNVTL